MKYMIALISVFGLILAAYKFQSVAASIYHDIRAYWYIVGVISTWLSVSFLQSWR